jgi:hypothetical protein
MIEVYRIEHKETGLGPYQTRDEFTQKLAKRLTRNQRYFPHPGDDGLGLGNIPHWYSFGCPTLNDLKRWVLLGASIQENDSIIQKLDEMGFCMKYYLVEEDQVIMGWKKTQLVFGKEEDCEYCISDSYPLSVLMKESPFVFDIIIPEESETEENCL